jgi:hypothetical protein
MDARDGDDVDAQAEYDVDDGDGAAWVNRLRSGSRLLNHDVDRERAHEDAKAHLAKATEFLEAATMANDAGLYNAAASDAVISGINSKNVICLRLTGRTGTTGNHAEDIAELKASGAIGQAQAATFDRLLRADSGSDAGQAIGWADQLLEAAKSVVR